MLTSLLLINAALAIPPDLGDWNVLQEGPVWIGCADARGYTWCRSKAELPGPLARVDALLNDFANYPQVMKRISETRVYEPTIVHVVLDMPFPFASRDYIVEYVRKQQGEAVVFDFRTVSHPSGEPIKGSVRLPHAEGQWMLEPLGPSSTRVTYTWNGELLGDFPTWALPRAWSTQGAEVMEWLSEAL